jgi:hypothetical protein
MEEKHYRIIWVLDVEASSPMEAIKQAIESMPTAANPDSIATVFDVKELNQNSEVVKTQRIDLLEESEDKEIDNLEKDLWNSPTGSPEV